MSTPPSSLPPKQNDTPGGPPQSPPVHHRIFFWIPLGILAGSLLCASLLPSFQSLLLQREGDLRIAGLQQEIELQNAKNEALQKELARLQEALAGDPCEQLEVAPDSHAPALENAL